MSIIDGKKIAQHLCDKIARYVQDVKQRFGKIPGLAVVLIGDNPASAVYVKNKIIKTKNVGFFSYDFRLPASVTQRELSDLIYDLNQRTDIHGILIQLPLPEPLKSKDIINILSPQKDVDGLHPLNAGRLAHACVETLPPLVPCTPLGCLFLLKLVLGLDKFDSLEAVVIGRSNLVGRPLAQLLMLHNATVTLAHSKTKNLPEVARRADILVAAIGSPHKITQDYVKDGAVVIDVGINQTAEGKLKGDVDFDQVIHKAKALTPVPGGVGPMTIACLLYNCLRAFCLQENIPFDFPLQFSHSWEKERNF